MSTPPSNAVSPTLFSETYREARERFLEAARKRGGRIESYVHPLRGYSGEELALDTCWIGPPEATDLIILSSGLHGAEGRFGSAAQLAALEYIDTLPPLPQGEGWGEGNQAFLFLHALNPWGFCLDRRVNENNIDLNRHFLDDEERPHVQDPAKYAALNSFLNPDKSGSISRSILLPAIGLILRHGFANLQRAISAGQSSFPQGLFYRGNSLSWTALRLQEIFSTVKAERIFHLDFHTGLGKSAGGALLQSESLSTLRTNWLRNHFPETFVPPEMMPVQTPGSLDRWVPSQLPGASVVSVCAELGTYPPLHMLKALRYENWAHFRGTETQRQLARNQIREAFCPTNPTWRTQVLQQSLEWIVTGQKTLKCLV